MSLYDDVEDVPGTNQSEEPQPSIVKVHFKPASPGGSIACIFEFNHFFLEKPAIDLRFLQSQLKAKKAQLQNAPTTVRLYLKKRITFRNSPLLWRQLWT